MIYLFWLVLLLLYCFVQLKKYVEAREKTAHVHGRWFAAMYTLYLKKLPPDPLCDHAFKHRFYPQGEADLRQFLNRYSGSNGAVESQAEGSGDYFTCVARHKETGMFHGLRFTHHVDDDGTQFWKEDFRTSGYDTEDAAKGHIDLLYPSN